MESSDTEKKPGRGLFFSRPGFYLMIGVLIVGGWFGIPALVFLAGTMLGLAGLVRTTSRLALWRVSYQRALEETRAFPGEEVRLVSVLENRKFLPVSWVETREFFPAAIAPDEADGSEAGVLSMAASLLWYRRQVRRFKLPCRKRGYYPLAPARVSSGDIFGLFPRTLMTEDAGAVIVYPRVYDIEDLGLPSREPLGEVTGDSRLFRDPTRVMGTRDLTPETPFSHINWKATARRGRLQVKVFEPSTTWQVYLFLDVDGFAEGEEFESAVSLTASLACRLSGEGQAVGVLANSAPADTGQGETAVFPGSGPDQAMMVLEALAKVTAEPTRPFADFFESLLNSVAWGATICLVTRDLSDSLSIRLADLRQRGFCTMVYSGKNRSAETSDKVELSTGLAELAGRGGWA